MKKEQEHINIDIFRKQNTSGNQENFRTFYDPKMSK